MQFLALFLISAPAVMARGPLEDIQANTRKMKEIGNKWHKAFKAFDLAGIKRVADIMADAEAAEQQLKRNAFSQNNELAKIFKKSSQQTGASTQEAITVKSEVETDRENYLAAATTLEERAEEEQEAAAEDFEDQANAAISEIDEDTQELEQDLEAHTEETTEMTEEVLGVALESMAEESDALKESGKEFQGRVADTLSSQKEVKSEIKAVNKVLDGVEKMYMDAVTKAKQAATNFQMQLSADSMAAQDAGSKGTDKTAQVINKELAALQKEVSAEQKRMASDVAAKQKEFKSQGQAVVNELMQTRMQQNKEALAFFGEQDKAQLDFDNEVQKLVEKGGQDAHEAARQAAEAMGKVNEEKDNLARFIQGKNEKFQGDVDREAMSMRGQITAMTDEENRNLMDLVERIKNYVNSALSDSRSSILEGGEQVMSTTTKLDDEISDVLRLTYKISKQMNTNTEVFSQISEEDKATQADVTTKMNDLLGKIQASVVDLDEAVTQQIEATDSSISEDAEKEKGVALEQLSAVKDSILQKINEASEAFEVGQQKTTRHIEASQQEIAAKLASLQTAVGDLEKESGNMAVAIPEEQKATEASYGQVRGELEGLFKALDKSKGEVAAYIEGEQQRGNAAAVKDLEMAQSELKEKFATSNNDLAGIMKQLRESLAEFEEKSNEQFGDTAGKASSLSAKIQALMTTVSEYLEKQGSNAKELSDYTTDSLRTMRNGEKAAVTAIRGEIDKAREETNQAISKAQDKFASDVKMRSMQSSDSLEKVRAAANAAFQEDEDKRKQFLEGAAQKQDELSQKANSVGMEVETMTANVNKQIEGDKMKMDQLAKNEESQIENGRKKMEDLKKAVAGQYKQLDSMVFSQAGNFAKEQKQAMHELSKQSSEETAGEQSRQKMGQEQAEQAEKAFLTEADRSLHAMDDADHALAASTAKMQGERDTLSSEMINGVQSAKTAVDMGEAKVQNAIQGEEKKVVENQNDGLGDMEGLLVGMQSTQAAADEDVAKMAKNAKSELEYMKKKNEFLAEETAKKIEQLEDMPDLAGQFEDDVKPVKKQLDQEADRLKKEFNQTETALKSDASELESVRGRRMQRAIALHNEATEMKEGYVNEMSDAVDKLEKYQAHANGEYKTLGAALKKFDQQLTIISGFESNHDTELIDDLKRRAYKLQTSNEKLLDWQRHFKYRTLAFNTEVERRLRQLEGQMEEQESQIANERLNEDMMLNKNMRRGSKSLDEQMSKLSSMESAGMSNMVDNVQKGMGKLMNEEQGFEAAEAGEMKEAERQVTTMNHDTEEAMGQLQAGASKVADEVGSFREQLSGKTQAINNKLFLQQKELEETDAAKKELELRQRLAQLGSKSSGSFAQLRDAGSSAGKAHEDAMAEEAADEKTDEQKHEEEKQALLAFNAKMEKENARLEQLDDSLDGKVASLQGALKQLQLRQTAA